MLKYLLVGCAATFMASPAFAGFATYAQDWPDDAAAVNEKIPAPETPAKVTAVKAKNKTTVGASNCECEGLTFNDIDTSDRISQQDRLYAKFGATFVTGDVRKMQNISLPALSSAYLINTSAKENYISWEFGLGARIKALRYELEYMYNKDISYNPDPLFANLPEALVSTLESQGLWLNVLWDLEKLNLPYFTPYLGVMGGFIWNKTRSTMTGGLGNGVAQNHSNYSVGIGATIGVRAAFWTRWFGYIGYKYLDQGTPRWQDGTGIMQLKGHYIVDGVDIGVQYLLG
jgi:hypothetical protein